MSVIALIVALAAPPPLVAAPMGVPAAVLSGAEAPWGSRLALWGSQVRWDEAWRAYVAHETPDRGVVPVWERFETPNADIERAAPSFIVTRELDCGRRLWRTTAMITYAGANLAGPPEVQPVAEDWREPAAAGAELLPIWGAVCRR